jgi:hypothetical protein
MHSSKFLFEETKVFYKFCFFSITFAEAIRSGWLRDGDYEVKYNNIS